MIATTLFCRTGARADLSPLSLDETPPPRQAEEPNTTNPAAKKEYNLFHPTPRALLRELQTDRPDQTEGPYTVDAGHMQIELDLANYAYDRSLPAGQHGRVQQLLIAPTNFRIGLLNDLELDVIATPFIWERDEDFIARTGDQREGVGDTLLQLKLNLIGNDSGDVAFGLLPYVKIPTNQDRLGNHYIEGGIIFPLNLKLPGEFELGMETAVGFLHDGEGAEYHQDWVNSIVLGHDIIREKLTGYVEFFSIVSNEPHAGPIETIDTGVLLAINSDVQLDCGINFGITRRATDFNPFVGLSVRF
ncbi:MAG TPA: transporter [Tepidisphaeraceae bacterium]|nr:transporter [Tepidisphaeraceae bacterium]